ncbi:transposase [Streptomyces sp. NBC_01604]|uniref:transposase n=1 Tax=Streptomyces sp. NBC_01604 TaxID=2975894 RepID=UPI003866496F
MVIGDVQSLRAADTVGADGQSDGQGQDGGKKVAGRKGHVAVDCLGLLLVVLTAAASVQDPDAGIPLLTRPRSPHRRSPRTADSRQAP